MHPAFSIVFFTTATGTGYGLLAALGIAAAAGALPQGRPAAFCSLGLSLGLVVAGLLSSTGHLGRPERAWRAFSQWRSSWLSREGIASLTTFGPALAFGGGWLLPGGPDGWVAAAGLLSAACAAGTVFTTAMIYASLKPIAEWHSRYTVPGYMLYAAAAGSTGFAGLRLVFGPAAPVPVVAAAALSLAAWSWKRATWRHNDGLRLPATLNTATGLGEGRIRSLEWPHSGENYVLKEMGFRIARKHAVRLRRIAELLAFAGPALLLLVALPLGQTVTTAVVGAMAFPIQFAGLLVERWLFFAEARHTAALYYGR